ncbi:MAG TPA: ABC transporter permease [Rugosimonospora sp.]|jgi:ABC-2 type transport system permease protein
MGAVGTAVRPAGGSGNAASGGGSGRAAGGGLGGAVAAEWTKLWSVRSIWWSLLAGVVLMVATSAQLAIYTANSNTNADPSDNEGVVAVGTTAIRALELAQFALVALAMLAITSEYSTGTIRATLQWVPRRGRLLLAKTAVVGSVVFVAGALLGILGAFVARPVLGGWASFPASGTLGDALAIGLYLALIGAFTLGVGAALRSAVATLITVFMILTVVPALLQASSITVIARVADGLPGVAGEHFMLRDTAPYPAGVGLAVLAAWAVAGLVAGLLVLRRRDA